MQKHKTGASFIRASCISANAELFGISLAYSLFVAVS